MTNPARRPFGLTPAGEQVELLCLDNGVLSCQIITYGSALRTLLVPDRTGAPVDVVLGYDTLEEYLNRDGHFGAVVGRYANRIAGGKFPLNCRMYSLAVNNGPNHLHGGPAGFSRRVWSVEALHADRAVLTLDSPDGDEGYPGRLAARVTYALEGNALTLHYEARSDADTPCSLTNHSYFNLAGQGAGPVLDQEITLYAARYTPADETSIPLGTLEPVEGTPMDLRRPTPIGARIDEPFQQLIWGHGYDHNFVVDGPLGTLRPAARVFCQQTGIELSVDTTLPGIQLYTANFLDQGRPGKAGAKYGPRHAFCLETQFFPDSPNRPAFPSSILRWGQVYDHMTRFAFSAR